MHILKYSPSLSVIVTVAVSGSSTAAGSVDERTALKFSYD